MNVSETMRPTEPRADVQPYVTGALLALALTLAPFAMVMSGASGASEVAAIFGFAVIQIVVHLVFFFHLGRSPDQRWNLAALVFTALIIGILVGGSYWVMHHLDHNMMPNMSMSDLIESELIKA